MADDIRAGKSILEVLERRGLAEGWLDDRAPGRLEQEARDEVEAAVRFARESPFPPPALTSELVYA